MNPLQRAAAGQLRLYLVPNPLPELSWQELLAEVPAGWGT
jgi:hypothetical protein